MGAEGGRQRGVVSAGGGGARAAGWWCIARRGRAAAAPGGPHQPRRAAHAPVWVATAATPRVDATASRAGCGGSSPPSSQSPRRPPCSAAASTPAAAPTTTSLCCARAKRRKAPVCTRGCRGTANMLAGCARGRPRGLRGNARARAARGVGARAARKNAKGAAPKPHLHAVSSPAPPALTPGACQRHLSAFPALWHAPHCARALTARGQTQGRGLYTCAPSRATATPLVPPSRAHPRQLRLFLGASALRIVHTRRGGRALP